MCRENGTFGQSIAEMTHDLSELRNEKFEIYEKSRGTSNCKNRRHKR